MSRHPRVVNADEVDATRVDRGPHRFERRTLGARAGNRQLGASVYEIPPGGRSYPMHWHGANEESVYVLAGAGRVRIGADEVAVRAGDWIAFPVGPEHAHQLINDGDAPLVYLCVSTDHRCEVIGYPDAGKVRALAAAEWDAPWVDLIGRPEASLPYWDDDGA